MNLEVNQKGVGIDAYRVQVWLMKLKGKRLDCLSKIILYTQSSDSSGCIARQVNILWFRSEMYHISTLIIRVAANFTLFLLASANSFSKLCSWTRPVSAFKDKRLLKY